FFAEYEGLAAFQFKLTQAEVQAQDESGGWRSLLNLQHYDTDTTDYDSLGYRTVSDGIRIDLQGHATDTQFKDFHAITSNAIANVGDAGGSLRAVCSFVGTAIQVGSGPCLNELRLTNRFGTLQSSQIVGWLITLEGRMGDADGSHFVRGL